jgi:hypothetical protein
MFFIWPRFLLPVAFCLLSSYTHTSGINRGWLKPKMLTGYETFFAKKR